MNTQSHQGGDLHDEEVPGEEEVEADQEHDQVGKQDTGSLMEDDIWQGGFVLYIQNVCMKYSGAIGWNSRFLHT